MRTIELTQGKVALVDDEDFDQVSAFRWSARKNRNSDTYYAVRTDRTSGKRTVLMHRFLLHAQNSVEVDHINGNGLDCRRVNLRLATHSENQRNAARRSDNTSGFKGVTWNKQISKWRAYIKVDGDQVHLGYFTSKAAARNAYDEAAIRHFGEFARTNKEQTCK